jgi:hypothetical protein
MLPLTPIVEIHEYHDQDDHSPFQEWFEGLNSDAARKITTALYRTGLGTSPT